MDKRNTKSNNNSENEEEDMMFYANILLGLPQLVALDEARKLLEKESLPLSNKKRSSKCSRSLVGFKCGEVSYNSVSWGSRKSRSNLESGLAGKKRKRINNPNPDPTTAPLEIKKHSPTLLKVRFKCSGLPPGHTNHVAPSSKKFKKKRKKHNPNNSHDSDSTTAATNMEPPKKQMKIRFIFSGRRGNGDTVTVADKDSSSSSTSGKADSEPCSMVDNNPQTSESEKKNNNMARHITKPLIPDLNISIMEENS